MIAPFTMSLPQPYVAKECRNIQMNHRIVPKLPPREESSRIVIDSNAANELDDLYAIALAPCAPERF